MDVVLYWRAFLALILVLGLILGLTWALRRYGGHMMSVSIGGKRRLAIVEALQLDSKHRLVLLRRDGTEHLVILGGGVQVVETGIGSVVGDSS